MSGGGQGLSYAARIAPLRPETRWTIDGETLVETTGGHSKAWPLAALRSAAVVGEPGTGRRAAHLTFANGRLIIPAQSLTPQFTLEDRSAAFDAFLARLGVAAPARAAAAASGRLANALVWTIGLTAAGAAFMIVAALVSGMAGLGLALGARLLFVPILLAAALPWLGRDRG